MHYHENRTMGYHDNIEEYDPRDNRDDDEYDSEPDPESRDDYDYDGPEDPDCDEEGCCKW
jgi:hypothetical protein